jgi:hypothetical protein
MILQEEVTNMGYFLDEILFLICSQCLFWKREEKVSAAFVMMTVSVDGSATS